MKKETKKAAPKKVIKKAPVKKEVAKKDAPVPKKSASASATKKNWMVRMSDGIAKVGNKLPHPVIIFAFLAVTIAILSALLSAAGFQLDVSAGEAAAAIRRSVTVVITDASGAVVSLTDEADIKALLDAGGTAVLPVKNLLNGDGLQYIFTNAVKNFSGFAPLGVVLVAMLGIGISERSGLITVVLKKIAGGTSRALLPYVMVFLGIMSNIASDAGYVVLVPLGASLFYAAGRHPLAGMAAAFAGVSAGFSANLLPSPTDALLINITNEVVGKGNEISVLANYFFMIFSTFVITIAGGFITANVIEPSLGEYKSKNKDAAQSAEITPLERKGLRWVLVVIILLAGLFTAMAWPVYNVVLDSSGAEVKEYYSMFGFVGALGGNLSYSNPFIQSLVFVITILFAVMGIVYGKVTKSFGKGADDIVKAMNKTMGTMGGYLVLVFFAAQFIKWFSYSQLDWSIAIGLAGVIPTTWNPALVLWLFILVTMLLNLFIGSASAKWTLMAPIFVTALSVVEGGPQIDAAAVTAAYRVGDSVTNIISPLMSYLPLVITFAQEWDEEAGLGTVMGMMFPYSMAFFAVWSVFFVLWMLIGLPFGI